MAQKKTDAYTSEQLESLHACLLELVDAVDAVCTEHGIEWWLDSGSTIGALRHKGFIPWDDDVDIGMLWQDYLKFLEVAPKALPAQFRVDDPFERPEMASVFAKVVRNDSAFQLAETRDAGYDLGIYIDLFPYVLATPDKDAFKEQAARMRRIMQTKYLYYSRHMTVPHKGLRRKADLAACAAGHLAAKALYSPEKLNRMHREATFAHNPSRRCPGPGDLVMNLGSPRGPHKYETFHPTVRVEFEGRMLPVPADADAYLSAIFRNWRELPPPERRKSHAPLKLEFPAG